MWPTLQSMVVQNGTGTTQENTASSAPQASRCCFTKRSENNSASSWNKITSLNSSLNTHTRVRACTHTHSWDAALLNQMQSLSVLYSWTHCSVHPSPCLKLQVGVGLPLHSTGRNQSKALSRQSPNLLEPQPSLHKHPGLVSQQCPTRAKAQPISTQTLPQ